MNGSKSGFSYGVVGNDAALAVAPVPVIADNPIAPLNYFLHSYGPASMPTMHLGWVFVVLLAAIFVIISLLLIWAVFHKRSAEDSSSMGREDQGMLWIYIGTGISTCILFALAIYMLVTLNRIAKPTHAPALTLTVTGYDWWWKIGYEDSDSTRRFVTANEIHIPVGQPVLVKLKSADVIHAFWVPVLAGKTQMIPGLINQQWIEADVEGVYLGQCAQYCGVQHAHMGLEVVAQSAAEFQKWQDAQRKTAATVLTDDVKAGWKIFRDQCSGCHTIRGTEAVGAHAPDLTHLHYVLLGINVFPVVGGIYYWFPKFFGRMMNETLGKWSFWVMFIGFNLGFFPMHVLGLLGMPRRIYTYAPHMGWSTANMITSAGSFIFAAGILIFLANILLSLKRGALAGSNPWDAPTLEWAVASPPPVYNFAVILLVASRHPLWEDRLDEGSGRSSLDQG